MSGQHPGRNESVRLAAEVTMRALALHALPQRGVIRSGAPERSE